MDALPTFTTLISNFTAFLTVSVHTILHVRAIYPASSFLTARAYNYPVFQSRHPRVCAWINDAVAAVEAELSKGTVDRVAVVLYSPRQVPLERFMFDVSRFAAIPKEDLHTPIEPRTAGDGDQEGNPADRRRDLSVDLEEQYRAAMATLTTCGSKLTPLPKGCSFSVAIELKEQADPPIGHPQPWIAVQPSLQTARPGAQNEANGEPSRRGENLGGAKTTPVRTVDAADMVFEMWIEEGKAKVHDTETSSSGATS